MVTSREKYLYHQIHPAKLLCDFSAAFAALYPFWRHWVIIGLLVLLIPPLTASFLVIRLVDLEPYKQSAFGKYFARYMTPGMDAVRLLGMTVMAIGALLHSPAAIGLGIVAIALVWTRGIFHSGGA